MPPRFAYWTIILEGKPTAFRAQQREDLLPTLRQLQNRHPDVVMKWFGRGRLWDSPEEAQAAQRGGRPARPPQWRPGGEHRDPRERFKIPRDEKRRRFAQKLRRQPVDRPRGPGPQGGPAPERPRPALREGDRPPRRERHDRRPREEQGRPAPGTPPGAATRDRRPPRARRDFGRKDSHAAGQAGRHKPDAGRHKPGAGRGGGGGRRPK